jgi:hypothetical protein
MKFACFKALYKMFKYEKIPSTFFLFYFLTILEQISEYSLNWAAVIFFFFL